MSQQINLLHKPKAIDFPIWYGLGGFCAIVLLLVSIAIYNEIRLFGIREDVRETEQRITETKKMLEAKREAAGLLVADALEVQISELRQRINARRELTSLIEKGEFGSPLGHSDLFIRLAQLNEPGVWIQGVDITKAGQSIAITGNALSNEAVIRYAGQLNQVFRAQQFEFTAMEMTKEDLSLVSESGPKIPTMKFRLY